MEFLSKLPDQLAENLRFLPRNAHFASILFALLVVAGALMFLTRRSEVTYDPLLEDQTFSLREIAKMKRAFSDAGLNDSRFVGGQIFVPRDERGAYLVAADEADALPAGFDDDLAQAVEKHSPLATREQIRMNYKYADQQKLARIVGALSGIETATVQYSEQKKQTFPPVTEKRAVVAVRAVDKRPLEYGQIETIRDTVAGYIVGLDRKDVTVVDMNAPRAYPGTDDSDDPHGAGHAYATKRMFESEYKAKIQERLSMYRGAVVGVNVHLEAPLPTPSAPGSGGPNLRRSLAPTLVTASIGLPKSYFRTVWRERKPDSDGSPPDPVAIERIEQEIKQKVERAVLALLPPPAPQWNTEAQVAVTSYDDASPMATAGVSWWMEAASWIADHWQVFGLGLAILLGALLFRGRRGRSSRTQLRVTEDFPRLMPETAEQASQPQASEASEPSTTPDPRGELSRRVKEDPDAAAEVLKQWLNKAA
jgi:flagellar biosynthesis/type III secretory pathway M-ring protein FliF/YscJ